MIRSAALMGAFAYFTAQTARVSELALASNAVLMQFLMISAFFLDGQGQAAEQLCGKAVGANYRPAFEQAIRLTMGWGLVVGVLMFSLFWFGGDWLIGVMTTNPEVHAGAREFLFFAAITAFTGMPAFVMDGVMIGATLNTIVRNGMVASFVIYLGAAIVLQNCTGCRGPVDRDQSVLHHARGDLLVGDAMETTAAVYRLAQSSVFVPTSSLMLRLPSAAHRGGQPALDAVEQVEAAEHQRRVELDGVGAGFELCERRSAASGCRRRR